MDCLVRGVPYNGGRSGFASPFLQCSKADFCEDGSEFRAAEATRSSAEVALHPGKSQP